MFFKDEPEHIKQARTAKAKTQYADRKHHLTKTEAQASRNLKEQQK